MSSFLANAPEGYFDLVSPEYPWLYIVLLTLLYCLSWSSNNWSLIQRYYSVPDEKEAIKTGWFVVALYVVGPPLMFLPAMAASQFLVGIPDKDVYPMLCTTLLPAGMLGLVIAAMFAATMSTLSGDYNVCAGVLTNDVYRRLIRPHASEKELVFVGRLMTLLVGAGTLGVALLLIGGSGEGLFRTMVTLFSIATAPVAVPMLLGLLSKRVTGLSAIIGFLAGFGFGLWMFFKFYHSFPEDEPTLLWGKTLWEAGELSTIARGAVIWDPANDEIVWGALRLKMEVALFAANALVTLLTMLGITALLPMKTSEKKRVEEFHQHLATPIGELDQDRAEGAGGSVFSPFFVVGVCILIIGVMMWCVVPWVAGALEIGLELGLGALLVIIGAVMVWGSRRTRPVDKTA